MVRRLLRVAMMVVREVVLGLLDRRATVMEVAAQALRREAVAAVAQSAMVQRAVATFVAAAWAAAT